MTTIRNTPGSEIETNESVFETNGTDNTDWSKENYHNSVEKMESDGEIISEACTNKPPDIINGLQVSKNTVLGSHSLAEATHVGANCMDLSLQKNVIIGEKGIGKWRIIRDILMISLAFMVHFTAFIGTSHLQSSVNAAEGLGTTALMTIYVGMSVSAIFLPVLLIKWLGCKWTLVVSQMAYMPYIAAQTYAKFYTLVPAALLVGIGGGPLWCSQSVYIKTIAKIYAEHEGRSTATILARFFGIFFTFYQTSEVWGNLISSSVFSAGKSHENNSNINISAHVWETCGYNFCPGSEATENNPNLERPANEKIYTVAGIYLSCMILASLIITFGVTSLKRYNKEGSTMDAEVSGVRLMAVTLKLLSDHRLLLLLPLTVWMGVEQVFRGADYTSGYVSCSWGISNIGYVLICYGVTNSLASFSTGYLVKLTGRFFMVLSATVIQIGITVTLYVWTPDPTNSTAIFFIISGLWGITDAVWLVQMNALYGTLFPGNETAAYCNFRTWKSMGFIVAYAYSPKLCANVKLHIVLTMLIIGTIGFCIVEWLSRPHRKDKK